jgi:hypothetical protein
VEKDGYGTRSLIREIVLSKPFRYTQSPDSVSQISEGPAKRPPRRLLGTK